MFLKNLVTVCCLLLISLHSYSKNNCNIRAYYSRGYHWNYKERIKENNKDSNRFIDWTDLYYSGSLYNQLHINIGDDFILKGSDFLKNVKIGFRQTVYQDLLQVKIDHSLSFNTFVHEKGILYQNLIRKVYDEYYFRFLSDRIGSVLTQYNMPFRGDRGLIKLILDSGHYYPEDKITSIHSIYTSNHYEKLIIDMRGIAFSPSLFPRIYSFDKYGNKKIIYDIEMSKWQDIIQNGYANYYSSYNLCNSKIRKNKSLYYAISGIGSVGSDKNDILISREDYLKFFSSKTGVKNLREGQLVVIMDNIKSLNK